MPKASGKTDPICARLPHDLDAAVRMRATSEGLSPSEMLRAIVSQFIYAEVPATSEGYLQARALAARLAHEALARTLAQMPDNYDEALALFGMPLPR